MLLTPGGCHSNLRFFTRGSVIGGESISLRAFAVINQRAVLFTAPVLRRLDREMPNPKHSDGLQNSRGKRVRYNHRLCESFDNGAESSIAA